MQIVRTVDDVITIELEQQPHGGVRVLFKSNGAVLDDTVLRSGKLVYVIEPPKKKKQTRRKPKAQNISEAGGIETEENVGAKSVGAS